MPHLVLFSNLLTHSAICGFVLSPYGSSALDAIRIMKIQPNKDAVLAEIEHDNGRTYAIKYIDGNAENARFVVTDGKTGQKLGGFESLQKATNAAKLRDKPLSDPAYEPETIKIAPASEEEVKAAMARVFPRSELTRQLQELQVMKGLKVQGSLKKVRTAVYSFAQISKRKFTVRPSPDSKDWLLIIRVS